MSGRFNVTAPGRVSFGVRWQRERPTLYQAWKATPLWYMQHLAESTQQCCVYQSGVAFEA